MSNGTGGSGISRGRVALTLFGVAFCAIGATGRVEAWPEQLVPAYLITRGFHLYREIKFAHAPLLIEFAALVFRFAGFRTSVLRAAATAPGLAVMILVWRSLGRRGAGLLACSVAAAFLLATIPLWRSLAIYPDPYLAILAIPLLDSLTGQGHESVSRGGWIAGACVAMKQTAIVAALFGAAVVFARHGAREGRRYLLRMSVPTAVFAVGFWLAGSGADFFRWTVTVPLFVYRGRTGLPPTAADLTMLLAGMLPAAAIWLTPRDRISTFEKLLATGLLVSFSAVAFPKFEFLHLAAAIPVLAWMAGRSVEGAAAWAPAWVTGTGFALNAVLCATSPSPGGVAFWSSKTDDAAVAWLQRQAPAPLFLYGVDEDIFIRSGRVPPGRLYNNPDLWFHYLAEDLEDRQIEILRRHPETLVLRGRNIPFGDAGRALARMMAEGYDTEDIGVPGVARLVPKSRVTTPGVMESETRRPPAEPARTPASP